MEAQQNTPSWWDDCENCGYKIHRKNDICGNCAVRGGELEHTHLAYHNTDEAGNFAIVADNWGWADSRRASDRVLWAQKESVYATLRACGLPFNEYV